MMNQDYITVPVDMLRFGVRKKYGVWWGFDDMIKSWDILDKHPNTPVKELPIYHQLVKVGKRIFNIEPDENMVVGVERHRELYFDIRDNGFDEEKKPRILVRINDYGVIKVGNGHHRVSILKHLKYDEVTVKVRKREPRFLEFKEKLYQLYGEKLLYQPVAHPDFSDWTLVQNGSEEVFQYITENLETKNKDILDIGCCTGDFSYRLAELGGKMVGIDTNKKRIELAEYQRTYREAEKDNPVFMVESFESHLTNSHHYDVVLLLNVIHHYLRRDIEKAVNRVVLISENTENLVIQLDTKIPITIPELIEKIMNQTDFTSYNTYYISNHLNRPVLLFRK